MELTKRELFAAIAMQGLVNNPDGKTPIGEMAVFAVVTSDALIHALTLSQEEIESQFKMFGLLRITGENDGVN